MQIKMKDGTWNPSQMSSSFVALWTELTTLSGFCYYCFCHCLVKAYSNISDDISFHHHSENKRILVRTDGKLETHLTHDLDLKIREGVILIWSNNKIE